MMLSYVPDTEINIPANKPTHLPKHHTHTGSQTKPTPSILYQMPIYHSIGSMQNQHQRFSGSVINGWCVLAMFLALFKCLGLGLCHILYPRLYACERSLTLIGYAISFYFRSSFYIPSSFSKRFARNVIMTWSPRPMSRGIGSWTRQG